MSPVQRIRSRRLPPTLAACALAMAVAVPGGTLAVAAVPDRAGMAEPTKCKKIKDKKKRKRCERKYG